jgi:hypothetical protein
MSSDRTSCKLLSSGNIRLPRARLYYPHFYKPRLRKGETDQSKAKYQTTVLLPKGVEMAILLKAVDDVAVEKWGPDYAKKHKIKKPFLKTEDQPKMSELVDDYPVFLRLNSKDKPGVVFANGSTCGEDKSHEVYGGRWAFVSVRPFAYDTDGNKGVSLGLQNCQLLEDDDRLGDGRVSAESEFESAEVSSTEEMFS